jgi:hypothetical protein
MSAHHKDSIHQVLQFLSIIKSTLLPTTEECRVGIFHFSQESLAGDLTHGKVPVAPILHVSDAVTRTLWHICTVKLLPLPHPPVRARTDAQTNPSAQRATQLRSVIARVYAVSRQNQITTTVS